MTTTATAIDNCTFTFENSEGHDVTVVVSKSDKHHAMIIENYHGAVAFDVVTTEEARTLYPEAYIVNGEDVDPIERQDGIAQHQELEEAGYWGGWCILWDF